MGKGGKGGGKKGKAMNITDIQEVRKFTNPSQYKQTGVGQVVRISANTGVAGPMIVPTNAVINCAPATDMYLYHRVKRGLTA